MSCKCRKMTNLETATAAQQALVEDLRQMAASYRSQAAKAAQAAIADPRHGDWLHARLTAKAEALEWALGKMGEKR